MVLKLLVLLLIPIAAFLTSFLGILSFISPPEFTSFPQVLSSYINTCSCVPPLRVWIRGCLCDGFITCKALWISPGWKTVFAQDPCPHDIIWEAFSARNLVSPCVSSFCPSEWGQPLCSPKHHTRNVFWWSVGSRVIHLINVGTLERRCLHWPGLHQDKASFIPTSYIPALFHFFWLNAIKQRTVSGSEAKCCLVPVDLSLPLPPKKG